MLTVKEFAKSEGILVSRSELYVTIHTLIVTFNQDY